MESSVFKIRSLYISSAKHYQINEYVEKEKCFLVSCWTVFSFKWKGRITM